MGTYDYVRCCLNICTMVKTPGSIIRREYINILMCIYIYIHQCYSISNHDIIKHITVFAMSMYLLAVIIHYHEHIDC